MKKGVVYLVGAGPGDPGLITVKGLECIARADVIVYDYLVNDLLLQSAAPFAEKIYAGKMADHHTLKQEQINALLVEKAKAGHTVCRLKGGDPFLFGRGGEEALELARAGIDFEIVPGISAAVSVPAYAGIPVTHRGLTSTFAAITGHEDPTKETSDIDWRKISTGIGTLVFFMGVRNLSLIVKQLIENGRPANTPVALIRLGTLPKQRTITGTLATIADTAKLKNFKPPALIVVGEVVQLRESLNWFESKPLYGKTVVVTRARAQASELSRLFAAFGAEVFEFPAIRIEPPDDPTPLEKAAVNLAIYDWVIFTSVNGVDKLMECINKNGDSRAFKNSKICAIGPATAERLSRYGLRPDLIPEKYVAEAVVEALIKNTTIDGKRFLLPRADIARASLREKLEAAKAIVDEVIAYKTVPEDQSLGLVKELFEQASIDLVTFTSSSTVKHFAALVGEDNLARLIEGAGFASIGPITSETMHSLGIPVSVQAEHYTIPGLFDAACEYLKNQPSKTE